MFYIQWILRVWERGGIQFFQVNPCPANVENMVSF